MIHEEHSEDAGKVSHTPVFRTTHWSMIRNAGDSLAPEHTEALAQLCRIYWYPVYAFIRRRGHRADEAGDLTQAFFAKLLQGHFLNRADRKHGKFRWFLVASIKHFLEDQRDRAQAQKRGGDQTPISIDGILAENRFRLEPSTNLTPERLFERNWALTLLDRVRESVRTQYAQAGKAERFERLESFLPMGAPKRPYAETATALGISKGALSVELHQLKARFRKQLRAEIAQSVSTVAEIEDELRHLVEVFQD